MHIFNRGELESMLKTMSTVQTITLTSSGHPIIVRHQVVLQFLATSPYHNPIIVVSICADQYCIRPSAMLWLETWVEQCNLTKLGYQVMCKTFFCFLLQHIHLPFNALHLFCQLLLKVNSHNVASEHPLKVR